MKEPPRTPKFTLVFNDEGTKLLADPRILELLQALPVLPQFDAEQVHSAAAGLSRLIVFSYGRDLPKAEYAGKKGTLKELAAIGRASLKLANQLERLHKEAHSIVSAELREHTHLFVGRKPNVSFAKINDPVPKLRSVLLRIHDAAQVAHLSEHKAPARPAKMGRRRNIEVQRITKAAAEVFQQLTGLRVTRVIDFVDGEPTSPCHRFLSDLFKSIAIDTNVDEQIRTYLDAKRTSGEKSEIPPLAGPR